MAIKTEPLLSFLQREQIKYGTNSEKMENQGLKDMCAVSKCSSKTAQGGVRKR